MLRQVLSTRRALPLLFLGTVGCTTTIRPGQAGLRYSGKGLGTTVVGDGRYFRWPWNDILVFDTKWTSKTRQVDALTADLLEIPVRATVTYRPKRAELRRLATELGPSYYRVAVEPAFLGLVRAEFAKYAHYELALQLQEIERAITERLRDRLASKLVEIDRVSLGHFQLDEQVTAAISEKRTIAERGSRQLITALYDAEIARVAAQGSADAVRLRARGDADATLLKDAAHAVARAEPEVTATTQYLQCEALHNALRCHVLPVGPDGTPRAIAIESSRNAVGAR